eukprot:TRINITY_DN16528_c1_g2_i1.p2 TRINITY_DN16528_c1_g2~~TRINITY_DN16528_c1_g2_i1.p2  ORF type:complete len:116 (+),score=20.10 TRINITY_DN16528_c1_g2_i1:93-440(+)
MASFMFLGFLSVSQPAYESRVDPETEGKKLKKVWHEMEERCFNTYLNEADDDFKGVHPYNLLKHEVKQCRNTLIQDNRRDVLLECTERIVEFSRQCHVNEKKAEAATPSPGGSRD